MQNLFETLVHEPLKKSGEIIIKTLGKAGEAFEPLDILNIYAKAAKNEGQESKETGKDKNFTPLDTKRLFSRVKDEEERARTMTKRAEEEKQRTQREEEAAKQKEAQKTQAVPVLETSKQKVRLGQKRKKASSDQHMHMERNKAADDK